MRTEVRRSEEAALVDLMRLTNWGKWGTADERGALNDVTPEVVRQAVALVRRGRTFALGSRIGDEGAPRMAVVPAPLHFMHKDGGDWALGESVPTDFGPYASDTLIMQVHSSTHVDALAHSFDENGMYNGFSPSTVTSAGAARLGIEKLGGLVTRGVLLDIARYRGVDVLDAYDLITAEDIERCVEAEGVTVQRGDAVLIRTGLPRAYADDRLAFTRAMPGPGPSAALWLARREISLVGADNTAVQATPGYLHPDDPSDWRVGLHRLHPPLLRNLGIYMLEFLDLEEIAAERAYEFLFCLAPLKIKGGTGSPVNPLAVD